MKKFYKDNYITKKKVMEFLDKKGFYVVLFLCILLVTSTAYIVTKRNLSNYIGEVPFNESTTTITNPDERLAINNDSSSVTVPTTKSIQPASSENKTIKSSDKITANNTKEVVKTKTPIIMQMPVIGDIIQDFAQNSLIYSKTLEQWTVHLGIDIASERGSPVKAALGGTIENIYNDPMHGITIIIDNGEGIKTKYCNLSADNMVKKGAKINKGDVISGVGNTAIFESVEQSHLHFEVIKDGVNVNPKNYM